MIYCDQIEKPENPEKKPQHKVRTNNKLNPHQSLSWWSIVIKLKNQRTQRKSLRTRWGPIKNSIHISLSWWSWKTREPWSRKSLRTRWGPITNSIHISLSWWSIVIKLENQRTWRKCLGTRWRPTTNSLSTSVLAGDLLRSNWKTREPEKKPWSKVRINN